MQCLILAGGLGTRMKSVASDKPKALLPVGPSTFIDIQLQWLKLLGISEIIMALGHEGIQIEEHIKTSKLSIPKVRFIYDGPKLLGTGGAIKNAASLLSENFVVAYGDTLVFLKLRGMYQAHVNKKSVATMSLYENENKGDKSNVLFEKNRIVLYDKFHPTPEMKHVDYGVSVLNKRYFLTNTPEGSFDLAQFQTATSKKAEMDYFFAESLFIELGSPQGYSDFVISLEKIDYDIERLAKTKNLI